jgi:site-specific recombinase XerD
MLRHSRATHMLMDGESIYKVAKLLGDTVSTVEKRYGHVSVEYLMERRK